MLSALNGPEDWILRHVRTCLFYPGLVGFIQCLLVDEPGYFNLAGRFPYHPYLRGDFLIKNSEVRTPSTRTADMTTHLLPEQGSKTHLRRVADRL